MGENENLLRILICRILTCPFVPVFLCWILFFSISSECRSASVKISTSSLLSSLKSDITTTSSDEIDG